VGKGKHAHRCRNLRGRVAKSAPFARLNKFFQSIEIREKSLPAAHQKIRLVGLWGFSDGRVPSKAKLFFTLMASSSLLSRVRWKICRADH
jgi:hypothetical protein